MTSDGNMYMPVAPVGNTGDGFFGGNGTAFWLIILLAMFGWGNGGLGGNYGGNGGGFVGADIQRGFDQSALTTGINNIQTALCNGFAGVSNGFAQAEISANARQMADMNQTFALQTSFKDCCCENRLATAQLNTTIAQEGAATRAASAADRQMIMDKLCQLEMDGVKQNYENRIAGMQNTIDALRTANQDAKNMSYFNALGDRLQASQDNQTAALEQYLAPVPRPAYVVQNPNCCANGFGYGGCGGYAA